MTISPGITSDDRRVLSKSFSASKTIGCTVKEPCSILSPTFLIQYTGNAVSWNYLYCPDFGRYYFIEDITVMPGNMVALTCSVDVLNTYSNAISNISAYIERSSNGNANYIADGNIPLDSRTIIQNITFSANPFGIGSYVLTTLGGS